MRIGSGGHTYEWMDSWAKIPDDDSARRGWAHPGIVVTESGDVITCHYGDPTILTFDKEGNLKSSWNADISDGHGISLVKEGGTEYLWIADNGRKRNPDAEYEYQTRASKAGQVIKMTLDGQKVMDLERPDLEVYRDGTYSPTSVSVNEERHGGNGDIWVADGYGESYVHRFDKAGNHIRSINGEEGDAGGFSCPHGIFIDRRKSEPELYIADRSNRRVQVYDLEGNYKRVFGSDFLTSPSGFAAHQDLMIVIELRARLAVLDIDDGLVDYLGANPAIADVERGIPQDIEGWPNNVNADGQSVRSRILEPGKFNSPHGMAVDSDGNIYVAEWLIGGRITKLAKS